MRHKLIWGFAFLVLLCLPTTSLAQNEVISNTSTDVENITFAPLTSIQIDSNPAVTNGSVAWVRFNLTMNVTNNDSGSDENLTGICWEFSDKFTNNSITANQTRLYYNKTSTYVNASDILDSDADGYYEANFTGFEWNISAGGWINLTMEFYVELNATEDNITQYSASVGTRVPYVHYVNITGGSDLDITNINLTITTPPDSDITGVYENATISGTTDRTANSTIDTHNEYAIYNNTDISSGVTYNISVNFTEPAPTQTTAEDRTAGIYTQGIVISSVALLDCVNISTSTTIPKDLNQVRIALYRLTGGTPSSPEWTAQSVGLSDTDADARYDTASWVVPNLSTQTYKLESEILASYGGGGTHGGGGISVPTTFCGNGACDSWERCYKADSGYPVCETSKYMGRYDVCMCLADCGKCPETLMQETPEGSVGTGIVVFLIILAVAYYILKKR